MPMNRAEYPDDWEDISHHIRFERAGNRCECTGQCEIEHFKESWGLFDDWKRCEAINGCSHPVTESKVVLTVAHLDHDKMNSDESNLLAMCQRCHLTYDRKHHAANLKRNRRQAEIDAGQQELFD